MNSQSHVLMGALLFGRKLPRLAWAGALGGLLPDLPMFAIVSFLRSTGHPFEEIFDRLYWEHWWQVANAIGHSFLLWSGVCVLGSSMVKSDNPASIERGTMVFAFGSAALLHSCIDFLVHRNDGHMHFWPLSEWRFVSPISYWDPAHYGTQFSLFEAGLGVVMAIMLFRIFHHWLVRGALVISALIYAAAPAFFALNMSGH